MSSFDKRARDPERTAALLVKLRGDICDAFGNKALESFRYRRHVVHLLVDAHSRHGFFGVRDLRRQIRRVAVHL